MWMDLATLRYDINYCQEKEDHPVLAWPIMGQFKLQDGQLGCYMIPVAGKTKLGIAFFQWTTRFVTGLSMESHSNTWAFNQVDGSRAKALDYVNNLYQPSETIKSNTMLIGPECDVHAEYGAQHLCRRFLTTHVTLQVVQPHILELQCCCHTDQAKSDCSVNHSMIHLYSEVRNMKKTSI